MTLVTRRRLLTLAAPAAVAGCDRLAGNTAFTDWILGSGERLSRAATRLIGTGALAREYDPAMISPTFKVNGADDPEDAEYQRHAASGFADWALRVDGLVDRPGAFPLPALRAMPARTQITRHDCVEGWSAIGQWTGVRLSALLDAVGLQPRARYVVFHCADNFWGIRYYESIDLNDAFHEQTILAYAMNGQPLPRPHGAPLRLRVERQLGYKHAKFVWRVEAVESLAGIGDGKGGFWEDLMNYEWYAGI